MKIIDLNTWKRKKYFEAFMQMEKPHFNVCFNLNVKNLLKNNEIHFFSAMLYSIHYAALKVPEFRVRIVNEKPVIFNHLDISFNVFAKDELFSNHRMECGGNFLDFQMKVRQAIEEKNKVGKIKIEPIQNEGMILTSCLPWVHFTSISEPIFNKFDSIPRVSWGKYNENGVLPLSITAHHGLMDGFHISKFLLILKEKISNFLI